jgi:rhodanese-related sulfurtransferase
MILIDVRTKEEYEEGHIDKALNHDVTNMLHGMLPNVDKDEEITLYCMSGGRSKIAKEILEKYGFKKIIDAGSINNLR